MHKVILELCDNHYRYQFAAIYILYAVCIQTSVSIFDLKDSLKMAPQCQNM